MIGFINFHPLATRLLISLFGIIGVLTQSVAYNDRRGIYFMEGLTESIIPLKIVDNLIIIPVNLNGAQLNFILDTGIRGILVYSNRKISKSIGDTYQKKALSEIYKNKSGKVFYVYDVQLKLPGIVGKNLSIIVCDKKMRRNLPTIEIDGVIGYDLFIKFSIEVDIEKSQLILRDPNKFKPDNTYCEFPIEIYGSKPFITVNFKTDNNKRVQKRLLVDTGAMPSLILVKEMVPENTLSGRMADRIKLLTISNIIFGKRTVLYNIELFENLFSKLEAIVVERKWYSDNPKINRVGTLGMGFLMNYNFIIDYMNLKIYLKSYDSSRFNSGGDEFKCMLN